MIDGGYEWAEHQLREFIALIEETKKFRGSTKDAVARVKQEVPVVRQILLRLDPELAGFKTGGLAIWDKALDAAHAGIGAIKAATEVERRMGPSLPQTDLGALHPTVAGAARKSFSREDYSQAVSIAAEQVVQEARSRTGRTDLVGIDVWRQAFSSSPPSAGAPRLRWPGDPSDVDVRNMNEGLRDLAAGLQRTVRNTSAHHPDAGISREEAIERLAALSLLATFVERCEMISASDFTEGAVDAPL